MSLSWYALYSKPNKENFLYGQLCHREIEVYYPRLYIQPVNPRSRKIKPFFPGYLFVNIDLNVFPISSLTWIPGVNNVVSFDHQPAMVPEEIINGIKQNVARINQDLKVKKILQHGDPVIIQDGPFKGYQAIFDTHLDGCQRVRVLISLLHAQHIRVQMPEKIIKPQKS